jgi:hypothetical protein
MEKREGRLEASYELLVSAAKKGTRHPYQRLIGERCGGTHFAALRAAGGQQHGEQKQASCKTHDEHELPKPLEGYATASGKRRWLSRRFFRY